MNTLTVQSRMLKEQRILSKEELSAEASQVLAAQQDVQAFRPLYEKYYRPILGFVYNRVEDKEQAFDITSQVFHDALNSLHRYKDKGLPFSAWLFRIAFNLLGKHYRSGKVRRTVSIDDHGIDLVQAEVAPHEQGDAALYTALQTLEETEMQLVEMRFFEKRPFAEIAEILGLTESTVKQRMYKILEILKTKMNQNAG